MGKMNSKLMEVFDCEELLAKEEGEGTKAATKVIPLAEISSNDVIGIYFSAHWCLPCERFTPLLADCYKEMKAAGNKFDVVFASSDSNKHEFEEYYASMPWKAIKFEDRERAKKLSGEYKVQSLPALVLLDAKSGKVISSSGKEIVLEYGAQAFPFSEEKLQQCKREKAAETDAIFTENFQENFQTFGANATMGKTGELVPMKDICAHKYVGFVFGNYNHVGQGPFEKFLLPRVTEVLNEVRQLYGSDSFQLLYVPWQTTKDDSPLRAIMDFPGVSLDIMNDEEVTDILEDIFEDIGMPCICIVTGDGKSVVTKNITTRILENGAIAFPWTDDRLQELEIQKKERQELTKNETQQNFKTLFTDSRDFLQRGLGSEEKVSAEQLCSNSIIGFYFSASW